MSLIARLENAAAQLPESHVFGTGGLGRLVGALVLFIEHGDDFLQAAESESDEHTVHGFLTELAEAENERVAREQGPQPTQAGPAQAAQVQSAPVPVAPPASPAPGPASVQQAGATPTGGMFAQPQPQTENPSVADLVAQLQAAQAEIAAMRAGQGGVQSHPAVPDPPTAPTPAPDVPAGEIDQGDLRDQLAKLQAVVERLEQRDDERADPDDDPPVVSSPATVGTGDVPTADPASPEPSPPASEQGGGASRTGIG